MTITVPAYAKINLFLDIHSLRDNGYHNILSLMQQVSLHDDVSVSLTPSDKKEITVVSDGGTIPCDKTNLAYKAADIYPVSGKIEINIVKRIPVSAGLAGGSADAAATLIALNTLNGNKLSTEELCLLGSRLGADIPFCIKGVACLVEGIGEILTPIDSMPKLPIVIAKKGDGMSTPAAYKALDDRFNRFLEYTPHIEKLELLKRSNSSAEELCQGLFNIFETVVEGERPFVTEIKETMRSCGAVGAMMSGSGTSVFGIFENDREAEIARTRLTALEADAHLCYPL